MDAHPVRSPSHAGNGCWLVPSHVGPVSISIERSSVTSMDPNKKWWMLGCTTMAPAAPCAKCLSGCCCPHPRPGQWCPLVEAVAQGPPGSCLPRGSIRSVAFKSKIEKKQRGDPGSCLPVQRTCCMSQSPSSLFSVPWFPHLCNE